ncbi:MAG: hypothetical protein J7M25_18860 [Deltaproteobacteria bacterium]|nr:hypothetical protein [Deltaproteobacteria bacterium]
MRRSLFALTIAVVCVFGVGRPVWAGAPYASRVAVLRGIDRAYAAGQISRGQQLYYKVAAVKRPDLLPKSWRLAFTAAPASKACVTPVMVDAFQHLSEVTPTWQKKIGKLLAPPADLAYHIEATDPFPFRVSYNDQNQEGMAQLILDSAETAYQTEVTNWGFWAPLIEPGEDFFRIYIQSTGMGGGAYTAPYAMNPATDTADAFTYIVVDQNNGEYELPGIVAHEFNHTCQAAMDVVEVTAFWENTATYIMSQVFSSAWSYTMGTFPYFQMRPFYPLEHMNGGNSDMYEYGGALWLYFMEYLYGNQDPRWIREVWEGSVQVGMINEPDYFDVLSDKLQDIGGFDAMVKTFAQYRYFASSDDDGQHLPNASSWWSAEVAKEAQWDTSDLPITEEHPASADRPQPNGCNYIVLDITRDSDVPLSIDFDGQDDLLWNVDLLTIANGQDSTSQRMEIGDSAVGHMETNTTNGDKLVMVVCLLGGEGYDPDTTHWTVGDYTYSMGYLAPIPQVLSVDPMYVKRGTQDQKLTVHGEGFVNLSGLRVRFGQDKVAVNQQEFVSDQEIKVSIVVGATADLGPTDVLVENPGHRVGIGAGLLIVVDDLPADDAGVGADGSAGSGPGEGRGCGCRSAGSGPVAAWPFMLVFGLMWWRRRRQTR